MQSPPETRTSPFHPRARSFRCPEIAIFRDPPLPHATSSFVLHLASGRAGPPLSVQPLEIPASHANFGCSDDSQIWCWRSSLPAASPAYIRPHLPIANPRATIAPRDSPHAAQVSAPPVARIYPYSPPSTRKPFPRSPAPSLLPAAPDLPP